MPIQGANRLKFTPDGNWCWFYSERPDLAIINAATRTDVRRLKIGRGAAGILVQLTAARLLPARPTTTWR